MACTRSIFIILGCFFLTQLQAQEDTSLISTDTLELNVAGVDSIVAQDSIQLPYRLSPDSLETKVDFGSNDSMHMSIDRNIVDLYGEAYVKYQSLSLKAAFIRLNLDSNIAVAYGLKDTAGMLQGIPVFNDGSQEVTAERMRYNFKSRKGKTYATRTVEGDLQVISGETKFYAKGGPENRKDNVVYGGDALFTTCDHEHPHFGIRSKKQKIIAGKLAVVGPSNLEIEGVPTPIWLPFGFFPLKTGRRAGLLFPKDYQYSDKWGFGLANVGYYVPINEYMDAQVLTDIYFRGSFGIKSDFNYKKKYKYSGNVHIAYSRFIEEKLSGETLYDAVDKSFSIRISHRQDSKAHPSRTIGGTVNIQTNNYDRLNNNGANNVLNNQLNSNFTLSQRFLGTPFSASLGLNHSQNINTHKMSVTFPELRVNMQRIYPFKKKSRVGKEKWFEKISFNYSNQMTYRLDGLDTNFFSQETFDDARFGVRHTARSDLAFKAFKYIAVSPFVNLTELWYSKKLDQQHHVVTGSEPGEIRDSIGSERISDFTAIHQYSAGISMSTNLFGTVGISKSGWLRAFRHTLKPSLSLSYSPDYTDPAQGHYKNLSYTDVNGEFVSSTYSAYQEELFGGPSRGGEMFGISYNLTNIFEAKTFSKRDSSFKKIKFFDNISVSGNYNFIADSLNWSLINVGGTMRLFKGLSTLRLSAQFDPYALENGTRINTLHSKENGGLLRFSSATLGVSTGTTIKNLRQLFSGEKTTVNNKAPNQKSSSSGTLWALFDGLRISHNFNLRSVRKDDDHHVFDVSTHSVNLRGSIPLSPNWRLRISNIDYNFVQKTTAYPDIGIARDLHCWEMGVDWQPVRGTYSFFIRVKPGSLDFVRLPYKQNRVDAF